MGVIQMTTATTHSVDYDATAIKARAYVALKIFARTEERMESARADASAKYKAKLDEATRREREALRSEDGKSGTKRQAALYAEARDALAERDRIVEEKTAEMAEWKKKLALLRDARAEALQADRDTDSGQLALLGSAGAVPGMDWATKPTLELLYTALMHRDEDGAALTDDEEALLADLAAADVEKADIGLDAAAAIEADTEGAIDDDQSGDDEDVELPF